MKKKFSLWAVLSLAFSITLVLSVSISYSLVIRSAANQVKNDEEKLLLATGKQLAEDPIIINHLKENKTSETLQTYISQFTENFELDFIVVMDMNALRLTHPDSSKIGKHFEGGDETISLKGKNHVSISQGTLGKSLRVFVPVFSNEQQLGVVALGVKMTALATMIKQSQKGFHLSLIISLIFSLIISFCISLYLKRILFNLEPREVASLLEERNAMLEEMEAAVLVIDLNNCVLLANVQAQTLYHYTTHDKDLVGKSIDELILDFGQIDLETKIEQFYQQHGQDYLLSASPILVRGNKTGYIIFLRNATESIFVANQLANTTAYATALQSQSHEFMNKLHVIYSLAHLEAYEELTKYLDDLLTPEQEFSSYLSLLVKDPIMAGFLIGERQKFSEVKTTLYIEISPEIPLNNSEERTELITIYRYIHYALLQRILPTTLDLSIEWVDGQMITTYSFDASLLLEDEWLKIQETLGSFYFKQILTNSQSTITFNASSLILHAIYHKKETT
ncbi:Spo0B domain-containing protein [Vagococcus fluvialis]|uniref:Spo0B domain-containing protein n=1 Tax=Vagococcus fluvialis TaxID=2738 RepID=UPI003B5A93C7